MWDNTTITMLLEGTRDTLYMTLVSTFFGYVLGLPLGILLAVTDKEGIHPNAVVYKVLDRNVIVSQLRVTEFIFLFRHYRRASFRKRIISIKLSRRVSIPAFPS